MRDFKVLDKRGVFGDESLRWRLSSVGEHAADDKIIASCQETPNRNAIRKMRRQRKKVRHCEARSNLSKLGIQRRKLCSKISRHWNISRFGRCSSPTCQRIDMNTSLEHQSAPSKRYAQRWIHPMGQRSRQDDMFLFILFDL